jgi:hypothetical protein
MERMSHVLNKILNIFHVRWKIEALYIVNMQFASLPVLCKKLREESQNNAAATKREASFRSLCK